MISGKMAISRILVMIMIAAVIGIFFAGCGRKEMPSAPRQVPPQPVTDLGIRSADNRVELRWTFSKALSGSEPVKGFGVFRASESVSETCIRCPLLFHRVADIPFVEDSSGGPSVITYRDRLEKGTRYRYKVISYSAGLSSKDSNVVVAEGE